ncbi:FAD-dependent oxidoreductase [Nocardioides panacisoli]|uniref:phytoene desaturase family protein n=1 Tax=Nocardioides panacisoli TaxID=627624 RepID=UPI001C6289EA|nr:FAD-dependent oxidoreductase [Nocardioides panacisoli]QYJ04723.1 FAD-dependent oxidoreductase [Nocardioides panacisoli]
MSRIVVVGGGLGGVAAAARLAKQRHEVTLLEARRELGGAIGTVAQDGFAWPAGPTTTMLPAALRDLFRKSGRPLERELGADLSPVETIREHRFADRTSVRLPGGSRGAQAAALEELGPGLGEAWVSHVDTYAPVWDVLRRHYVENPWDAADPPTDLRRLFAARQTLAKRLRRDFRDDRLAMIAGYLPTAEGHDLRNVPAWAGLGTYLEQCFGVWQVPGGMARLAEVLTNRLATRRVTVLAGVLGRDLVIRDGAVAAVQTDEGAIEADAVVVAVDPRRLPALARHVERTMPAIPPVVTRLGLTDEAPALEHDVVLHGDAMITVRPDGTAPSGHRAWTLLGRGKLSEDMVAVLARSGLDVRDQVVTRVDQSPRELVEEWHGSPYGVLWQGRGTPRHRLGPTTPVPGVYAAGAHATPGAGVPFVVQSGALVAAAIGPAS